MIGCWVYDCWVLDVSFWSYWMLVRSFWSYWMLVCSLEGSFSSNNLVRDSVDLLDISPDLSRVIVVV